MFVTVEEGPSVVDVKQMRLRYAGTCVRCGASLAAGTTANYARASKTVACVACPPGRAPQGQVDPPAPPAAIGLPAAGLTTGLADPRSSPGEPPVLDVVDGQGGASAVAEFHRRHDARHEPVTSKFPRVGRFLLAVFDDPQSTKAWSVGAEGERIVSEMLASIAGNLLRVLHDRRIPGTRAKRYRNARPALRVEGGLLRPRAEFLTVGGRDRTTLVTGIQKQIDLVRNALTGLPEVPVRGVLCFVDADWPLIGAAFTVNGVAVAEAGVLRQGNNPIEWHTWKGGKLPT